MEFPRSASQRKPLRERRRLTVRPRALPGTAPAKHSVVCQETLLPKSHLQACSLRDPAFSTKFLSPIRNPTLWFPAATAQCWKASSLDARCLLCERPRAPKECSASFAPPLESEAVHAANDKLETLLQSIPLREIADHFLQECRRGGMHSDVRPERQREPPATSGGVEPDLTEPPSKQQLGPIAD